MNQTAKDKQVVIVDSSPAETIRQAMANNTDLDKLEKLLNLQEKWEATEAKKAFHVAMAKFKKNSPKIDKDKTVSYGNTTYSHASLANVTTKINAELSKHGLSASWTTKQNGVIIVTCKITHAQGHSEETSLSAPADESGSKNSIQAIGSTITYLERYTLLALTGLATHEDDDGAASSPTEYISKAEVKKISDEAEKLGILKEKFLEFLKIESLEKLLKSDLPKANQVLADIKAKQVKK